MGCERSPNGPDSPSSQSSPWHWELVRPRRCSPWSMECCSSHCDIGTPIASLPSTQVHRPRPYHSADHRRRLRRSPRRSQHVRVRRELLRWGNGHTGRESSRVRRHDADRRGVHERVRRHATLRADVRRRRRTAVRDRELAVRHAQLRQRRERDRSIAASGRPHLHDRRRGSSDRFSFPGEPTYGWRQRATRYS